MLALDAEGGVELAAGVFVLATLDEGGGEVIVGGGGVDGDRPMGDGSGGVGIGGANGEGVGEVGAGEQIASVEVDGGLEEADGLLGAALLEEVEAKVIEEGIVGGRKGEGGAVSGFACGQVAGLVEGDSQPGVDGCGGAGLGGQGAKRGDGFVGQVLFDEEAGFLGGEWKLLAWVEGTGEANVLQSKVGGAGGFVVAGEFEAKIDGFGRGGEALAEEADRLVALSGDSGLADLAGEDLLGGGDGRGDGD